MNDTTNIPDSWESRIKQASIIIDKKPEDVEQILKDYGVEELPTGMEMLSDENVTPFGDLRKIFCDDHDIAVPKLRMAMKFLRGPKNSPKTDSVSAEEYNLRSKYDIKANWSDLPTEELLRNYNPSRKDSPVNKVLAERFTAPVIAFKPDSREVAIEETINYITDLEDGFDNEDFIEVDGVPVKLYMVNQLPDQVLEEDPLYPHNPLKRGRSVINRLDWTGVELEKRQFFRILVENNLINLNSMDRTTLRQIVNEDLKDLKKTYAEATIIFADLKKLDRLPKLKLTLDDVTENRVQNPFNVRKYR